MKPQFDNKVMSSFFLWFDNKLLDKGEAFENVTGQFYDASEEYQGFSTYASSYSQFVADASITGATIPTGVFVGENNLVNRGEGGATGLFDINYLDGKVYLIRKNLKLSIKIKKLFIMKFYHFLEKMIMH